MKPSHFWAGMTLTAGIFCTACSPTVSASAQGWKPSGRSLGINLSMLGSPFPEIPFVDAFKQFDPWVVRGTATQGQTAIRNGWVTSLAEGQFAQACAFKGFTKGHYPAGRYTVLYDGQGALIARGSLRIAQQAAGRMELDVTPTAEPATTGICLIETATNPSDPIRNIRVILPGFEKTYRTNLFYPPFLEELRPFQTIRFMPWAGIARSQVVEWNDRRPVDYATQALSFFPKTDPVTHTGVSLEYQVMLANTLHSDPWLNVPAKASDDYIRQMATYVHNHLRPDLHPYIEYSNEIWNGRFQSDYRYARDMGEKLNLDSDRGHPNAGLYWYALRSTQMFDIWNQVYGKDARKIAHVIAGQQNWPREAEIILAYRDTYKKADILAVGGYVAPFTYAEMMNPTRVSQIEAMTPRDVLASLNQNITASAPRIAAHQGVAQKFGLALAVYEGGTSFETDMAPAAERPRLNALFAQAQADPAIGLAYKRILDMYFAHGVILFNHFCDVMPPEEGGHGALNWQDQPLTSSPKYMVMKKYIKGSR